MRRITIWVSVAMIGTVSLAVLIYALQETGKALGTVKVDPTIAIIALVICAIILIAQVVSRAGVKPTLPVERYIITNGLAPRGWERISPDRRETGVWLMEMNVLSEQRMFGRQHGNPVEIKIVNEPILDYDASLALQSLRGDSGKHGVTIK